MKKVLLICLLAIIVSCGGKKTRKEYRSERDSSANQASKELIDNLDTIAIKGSLVKVWKSKESLMGGLLILSKEGQDQFIKVVFYDGSSYVNSLKISQLADKRIQYDYENKHGEYYILESNGNLGMYGSDGKFDEAELMK